MLELRYNKNTGEVTGWCGDEEQFGNLPKRWGVEEVVILDIPIPDKPLEAWLYDEETQSLIPNQDYVEPGPPRDLEAEIDKLKAKVAKLESKNG